jgi:hypothetical protein
MNEKLLAQIINGMRLGQQQGAVGNVSNNELARFVADPMNNTDAINAMRAVNNTGGAVGNVSDREASLFNMVAGGVSNPMPRINEMRNNLATAGSVGNVSDNEAAVMERARQELNFLKTMGQNRILDDDEKARALYLQDLTAPVDLLPVDIDGASAGNALTKEQLDAVLNRIYQMQGGR